MRGTEFFPFNVSRSQNKLFYAYCKKAKRFEMFPCHKDSAFSKMTAI